MFLVFYICLFAFVFVILHFNNGTKVSLWLLIFGFVLGGNLSKSNYEFILVPADWFISILFLSLVIYGLINRRRYLFQVQWPDKLIWSFYILVLLIPFLVNAFFYDIELDFLLSYVMPIRIWLVYRIFFYIMSESIMKNNSSEVKLEYTLNVLLIAAFTSSVLCLVSYLPITEYRHFFEDTWPIIAGDNRVIGLDYDWRLHGTMSGVNGAGNFFTIMFFVAFYKYLKFKKPFILMCCIIFPICVLLSGSLSSLTALLAGIFFISVIHFKRSLGYFIGIIIVLFSVFSAVDLFWNAFSDRFTLTFMYYGELSLIPRNLTVRISNWIDYLSFLFRDNRYLFGLGPGGMANAVIYGDGNPESFYMRIIAETGFWGFMFLSVIFILIFNKIKPTVNDMHINNLSFLCLIIFSVYLVANTANQTLFYGGSLELFALMLNISSFVRDNHDTIMEKKNSGYGKLSRLFAPLNANRQDIPHC